MHPIKKDNAFIQELAWNEIKADIKPIDEKLYNIIEEITPDDSYKLYKVSYSYGALIYDKGQFYLPIAKNEYKPLEHLTDNLPNEVIKSLKYQPLPLGFLLNNSFEVFNDIDNQIFPLAFRNAGLELGIWETFAPSSPYTVSAGARNIFMLPKISEASGHQKLRPLGVTKPKPSSFQSQWKVFKQIANHSSFPENWRCEILFFSNKWVESMKNDIKWTRFYNYVMQKAWQHTEPLRTQVLNESAWNNFIHFLNKNDMQHPNNYTATTLNHLIAISSGVLPAFKPLTNSDYSTCGPIKEITRIYLDYYGLKNHIPTFMHADYFNPKYKDPVYYSLAVPTCAQAASKSHKINSLKKELCELITLIDRFMEALAEKKLGEASEHLYSLFSQVQLEGFHVDDDENYGVYPVEDLEKEDPNLLYSPFNMTNRTFCKTSSFTKGVIRISSKS